MNTLQNYAIAGSDATSVPAKCAVRLTLPSLIEQLQNVQLLSENPALGNHYAFHRSVDGLVIELQQCISRLDSDILHSISNSDTLNASQRC